MLTTSLLVPDTNVQVRSGGTIDDPISTEVALLILPPVEVGAVSDSVLETPSAGVEAEPTDSERLAVVGAGSDIDVDNVASSDFELVTATIILEVRTSSVEELTKVVMPRSVDDIAISELVTCKRLDSTVDELSDGRCSSVGLKSVVLSDSR